MMAAKDRGFVAEIEQDVLGALLINADCIAAVRGSLREDHFLEPAHKAIFRAILTAFERYRSASPLIVPKLVDPAFVDAFKAGAGLPLPVYLARLASETSTGPITIRDRAKAVVEQWARLTVAEEASRIAAAAKDPGAAVADIISTAGQTFDGIMSDVRGGSAKRPRVLLREAMHSAFSAAREARERGAGLTGITWGLADLNRLTGGMQRRDLTLIGARPSMGKTTFAVSCGLAAAKKGHGVLILSLEMDRDKLAARAASDLAYERNVKVPYVDIIRGNVSEDDLGRVAAAIEQVERLPLWLDDQAGVTVSDIRVKIEASRRAAEEAGFTLDAVMLDHLGLIRASQRYAGNRNNEIAEMTGALKSMAREYDLALIVLSQLNRALESRADRRPQLSDLRDSGAIEQDADTIMFLHREAYYLEREKGGDAEAQAERTARLLECQFKLECHVAKQRNGPVRSIDLFADMACAAIRNGAQP